MIVRKENEKYNQGFFLRQGLRTKNFLDRVGEMFKGHSIFAHQRFNGLLGLFFQFH